MSIQIYQKFISKLPVELVRYIHEYTDPETTEIQTKIQKYVLQYPVDYNRGIYTPFERRWRGINRYENIKSYQDIKGFYNKDNILDIMEIMKVIPLIFKEQKKKTSKSSTVEAKQTIEHSFSYHLCQEDYKLKRSYVSRGQVLMAFLLLGFKMDLKIENDYSFDCHFLAIERNNIHYIFEKIKETKLKEKHKLFKAQQKRQREELKQDKLKVKENVVKYNYNTDEYEWW